LAPNEKTNEERTASNSLPKIGSISSQLSTLFRRLAELFHSLIDKRGELVTMPELKDQIQRQDAAFFRIAPS
jgi:hypothetical protein